MTGERSIRFTRNDKAVRFTEGEKKKGKLDKKSNKILNPIFDAILKLDNNGKKLDSEREVAAMQKLQQIFAFDGAEQLSESEIKMFADFKKGEDVEAFLDRKLEELNAKQKPADTNPDKKVEEQAPAVPQAAHETPKDPVVNPPVVQSTPKKKSAPKSSAKAFNQMIQNLSKKFDKDEWSGKLTQKVKIEKGDNLYTIAKKALQAEGVAEPNGRQINDRIAQIALVNSDKVKDVNNVRVGAEIFVSSAATGFAGNAGIPAQNPEAAGVEGEQSTITLSKPSETDGFTEEALTGDDAGITKYSKEVSSEEGSETVTFYQAVKDGVHLQAGTLEELKAQIEAFKKPIKNEGDTDATVVANIKEKIAACNNNIELIEYYIGDLKALSAETPELQALVKDLLLTRDASVVNKILCNSDNKFDRKLFEKDEASSGALISMYQEIQAKEQRGEILSKSEWELKEALKNATYEDLYKIEADTEKGIVEKSLRFDDAGIYYRSVKGFASSPETLDAFEADLAAADTDDKKKALFKKYSTTDDEQLAGYLLSQTEVLKADAEDVKTLIDRVGLRSLTFDLDSLSDDAKKALAERVKDIYTSAQKGDVKNMEYLVDAFSLIDESGVENKEDVKIKILESYFDVKTAEDGTKTYKYTGRKMSYDEASQFFGRLNSENPAHVAMFKAVVDTVAAEDVSLYSYTNKIEYCDIDDQYVVEKYASFVDGMESAEDVSNFIDNILEDNSIPFDKILEKFGEDPSVREKLVTRIGNYSTVTDENRISLIKDYMNTDKDPYTLKELKDPVTIDNLVSALPVECKEGEARKVFDAILAKLGKNDLAKISAMANKISDKTPIKNKLTELVKSNADDYNFVNGLLNEFYDNNLIPWTEIPAKTLLNAVYNEKDNEETSNNEQKYFLNRILQNGVDTNKAAEMIKIASNYDDKYKDFRDFIVNNIIEKAEATVTKNDKGGHTWNANYYFTQEAFDTLVAAGYLNKIDEKTYTAQNGKIYKAARLENENISIAPKSAAEISADLYKNIHNSDGRENKGFQQATVRALANRPAAEVVEAFKSYTPEGEKEGLLEALDYERDGASFKEMMGLVQKVMQYAISKGKVDSPEFAAMLNLLNGDKDYFSYDNGFKFDKNNAGDIVSHVNPKWGDKDFTSGWGTMVSWVGHNPAKDWDKAVMALIKACDGE